MSREDWLPQNHEALFEQALRTWNYVCVQPGRERMGFGYDTPQGKWVDETFYPKFNAFNVALQVWKNAAERTPVITTKLAEAESEFRPAYRQLYTGLLRNNPLVTDDDLVSMSLPKRPSGGGKPAPVPGSLVKAKINLPSPGVIEIHFFDADTERRAKPPGVHGAEIVWAILDTPPADWSDLINSSFDTNSPFRLAFELHQSGKRVYFALRWENTRGEKGPFGAIDSAVIP
jgi:hypothetical protein